MEASVRKIKEKLERKEALVVSAQEFKQMVKEEERLSDVDVVTCATRAVMSGTMLMLSFRAAERNEFIKARALKIGGIQARPGPCPNERLGYIDCTLHATDYRDMHYGGGHLIRELLEGKRVDIEIETHEGRTLHTSSTLDEFSDAKMLGTRCAFMNYLAIVNPSKEAVSSIFSIEPMKPQFCEAAVAGCGELNPVQNDPTLQSIGVGTRVLYNGAEGFVLGLGTRSYPSKPNLSLVADLKQMDARWVGGFRTSLSPEVINTLAVPIPITSNHVLEQATVLDEHAELMVASVLGRKIMARTSYADVWQDTDLDIEFDGSGADVDELRMVEACCPTGAFSAQRMRIDTSKCMHCGHCTTLSSAFRASLGKLQLGGRHIPITARLSDRLGAMEACSLLKEKILDGSFELAEPVHSIELKGAERKNRRME